MRRVIGVLAAALAVAMFASGADADHVCHIPPTGNAFVSLRTGPDPSYPSIVRLRDNKRGLAVSERNGEWAKVALKDGPTGWLPAHYVCPDEPPQ